MDPGVTPLQFSHLALRTPFVSITEPCPSVVFHWTRRIWETLALMIARGGHAVSVRIRCQSGCDVVDDLAHVEKFQGEGGANAHPKVLRVRIQAGPLAR